MSFSNSTASTRGGSAPAAVPVSARAAERAQTSAKKPRKSSIFECKNSIRVKLPLLSAEKAFVCLPRRPPCTDDPASHRPRRVRNRPGRSRCRPRSGPVHGARRAALRDERAACAAGSARLQPRRAALEGARERVVSHPFASGPVELLAGGGGRGRGLAGRRFGRRRCAPGLEAREPVSGPGRRRRSSTGSTAASRGCARTSSGATPKRSRRLLPGRVAARAAQPTIVRRAEWGADESIVRARPYYATAVRFAVVHHTAGTNSYSASESAAIVRGIERYHVLANGWNDIGYNFLVDKYGQVFEGRGGGIAKNVVGAHAEGFNTGSTGVAVIGNYESQAISPAARAALVKLLAWRLDVAHVNPLGKLTWTSGGNPRYPAGTKVGLRAVSGHRDTGPTSCPGGSLYAQLNGIASDVAATGLPKLYNPVVNGSLGGPVRFTATLTEALPWTVTIRDAADAVVATGSGTGAAVDWTWDASATPVRRRLVCDRGRPRPPARPRDCPGPAAARGDQPDRQPARGDSERRRHRRVDVGLLRAFDSCERRGRGHRLLVEGRPDAGELVLIQRRQGEHGLERAKLVRASGPGRPLPHPDHRHLAGPAGAQEPRNRGRPDARPSRDRSDALLPERRRPPGLGRDRLPARPPGGCPRADHGRRPNGGNRPRARDARGRRHVRFLGRPQQERGGRGRRLSRARRGDDGARDPLALGSRSRSTLALRPSASSRRAIGRTGARWSTSG